MPRIKVIINPPILFSFSLKSKRSIISYMHIILLSLSLLNSKNDQSPFLLSPPQKKAEVPSTLDCCSNHPGWESYTEREGGRREERTTPLRRSCSGRDLSRTRALQSHPNLSYGRKAPLRGGGGKRRRRTKGVVIVVAAGFGGGGGGEPSFASRGREGAMNEQALLLLRLCWKRTFWCLPPSPSLEEE